jgi:arsenate reductase (glutaredoxin)
MLQIFHNNRCGKSRKCLSMLETSGNEFEIISYLTKPPTADELQLVVEKLNLKPIDLVRQKEKIWIENFKGKDYSDQELIKIMVTNPILIERPILISDEKAIIARDEAKIINFFKK